MSLLFPIDVWGIIRNNLQFEDRLSLSSVCKRLRKQFAEDQSNDYLNYTKDLSCLVKNYPKGFLSFYGYSKEQVVYALEQHFAGVLFYPKSQQSTKLFAIDFQRLTSAALFFFEIFIFVANFRYGNQQNFYKGLRVLYNERVKCDDDLLNSRLLPRKIDCSDGQFYEITDADIELVADHANVSPGKALIALYSKNGDIVDALMLLTR